MIKRASIIWGRPERFVRGTLQHGKVDWGYAFKKEGNLHYEYHIEDDLLRQYVGEEKWQEGLVKVEEYKKTALLSTA